jgi:hypothetical protein
MDRKRFTTVFSADEGSQMNASVADALTVVKVNPQTLQST